MFDALFPNWTNPEVIAAIVGFRVLFNVAIFGYVATTVGVRSGYTAVLAILVTFSSVATVLLLSSGWGGHSASYLEQAAQVVILGVSASVAIRRNPRPISGAFLLAWCGAVVLLVVMVPLYGEAFVAP